MPIKVSSLMSITKNLLAILFHYRTYRYRSRMGTQGRGFSVPFGAWTCLIVAFVYVCMLQEGVAKWLRIIRTSLKVNLRLGQDTFHPEVRLPP